MHVSVYSAGHQHLAVQVNDLRVRESLNGSRVVQVGTATVPYSRNPLSINGKGSLLVEAPVTIVALVSKILAICYPFLWNFLNFRRMTPQNASPKIPPLILDVPSLRFTNMIGTSASSNPSFQAVYFISIWNP